MQQVAGYDVPTSPEADGTKKKGLVVQSGIAHLKHALSEKARDAAALRMVEGLVHQKKDGGCQILGRAGVAGAPNIRGTSCQVSVGTLQVRCGSSIRKARDRLVYCSAHATARQRLSYSGARDRSHYDRLPAPARNDGDVARW